jgi:hypothetical protein
MNIIQRIQAPTPSFFKKLRNVGLIIAAIGTTLITAPVGLPVIVTTIAGYLTVAGSVISAVSQVTTADNNNTDGK